MNYHSAGCLGTLGALVLAGPALAQQNASGLTVDDVRAIAAEVLADADNRSSLLQSGTAGHDGHFFLSDGSGNFRLEFQGRIQTRFTASFVDDDDVVNSDSFESGFSQPRVQLVFTGQVGDPSFIYRIQGKFGTAGGGFVLEDAYVGHVLNDDGWLLLWGQLRLPVLWEDVIKDVRSLAVAQSVVNAVFNPGRSQGIWVHRSTDDWRFWAGFSDGAGSANTDITAEAADWAVTSRVEFKFDGDWSQFDSFSSPEGSDFAHKAGLAAHWQDGPNGSTVIAETTVGAFSADYMIEADGWNFFAAGVGLFTEMPGGVDFLDWGVVVQGGMFLPDSDWELFGRFDAIIPDGDRAGDDAFNTLTFGANYYIHGHAAKFSVDAQWFFDATVDNDLVAGIATGAAGSPGTFIGLLPSANDNQLALRMQFQLLF